MTSLNWFLSCGCFLRHFLSEHLCTYLYQCNQNKFCNIAQIQIKYEMLTVSNVWAGFKIKWKWIWGIGDGDYWPKKLGHFAHPKNISPQMQLHLLMFYSSSVYFWYLETIETFETIKQLKLLKQLKPLKRLKLLKLLNIFQLAAFSSWLSSSVERVPSGYSQPQYTCNLLEYHFKSTAEQVPSECS